MHDRGSLNKLKLAPIVLLFVGAVHSKMEDFKRYGQSPAQSPEQQQQHLLYLLNPLPGCMTIRCMHDRSRSKMAPIVLLFVGAVHSKLEDFKRYGQSLGDQLVPH
ncbi:hypothetical protein PoB_007207400 [Plakobranchus ocellatus]|uniref:Uncharacterized protein n=1 Tax=Plakobranchus ocellatus TaxID=259542 RepID=A0AAV4DNK9_9GAST|nr:hypothetical protein PoB_007207400 [Plakobranchus ocellatus]